MFGRAETADKAQLVGKLEPLTELERGKISEVEIRDANACLGANS